MALDAQIVNSANSPAPKDYTIPGNAELVLHAVQASFTDNGAAGDWLPCLTLISDSGHVIARACDQGVKVTAGNDADVSWFQDVVHKPAASTAGGGATYAIGYDDTPQILVSGSSLQPGFATVSTTDAAVLAWSTSVLPNDTLTLA